MQIPDAREYLTSYLGFQIFNLIFFFLAEIDKKKKVEKQNVELACFS